jgi:hypothetical protein
LHPAPASLQVQLPGPRHRKAGVRQRRG